MEHNSTYKNQPTHQKENGELNNNTNPSVFAYFTAARPWSFSASMTPVILGNVLAYSELGSINITLFLLTVVCVVSIHCAGNLTNTYYDYHNGVDQHTSEDQTLVKNILKSDDVYKMSILAYLVGCISFVSIFLLCRATYSVLITLFLIGVSGSFFYTGSIALKYHGCGDVTIVLLFGPLCVLSAYVVQAGVISWQPVLYSLPLVFHTEAILHANNSRDREDDKRAGILTLAIVMGEDNCHFLFTLLLFVPYLCVVVVSVLWSMFFLLPLLSVKIAVDLEKKFRLKNWSDLPQETAKLNLIFGLLYISAFALT